MKQDKRGRLCSCCQSTMIGRQSRLPGLSRGKMASGENTRLTLIKLLKRL
jgi:hypothetical protein